jgi:hypothetical protein
MCKNEHYAQGYQNDHLCFDKLGLTDTTKAYIVNNKTYV